jgi:mevalonate kinase
MAKKDADDNINENLAKKIWLAGLGAYGRSVDQVQNRYEKISEDSLKAFDDLVAKGEAIQNQTTEKVKDKVKSSNTKLEARIEELKQKLSLTHSIEKKLDVVNSKLDKLSSSLSKKS